MLWKHFWKIIVVLCILYTRRFSRMHTDGRVTSRLRFQYKPFFFYLFLSISFFPLSSFLLSFRPSILTCFFHSILPFLLPSSAPSFLCFFLSLLLRSPHLCPFLYFSSFFLTPVLHSRYPSFLFSFITFFFSFFLTITFIEH